MDELKTRGGVASALATYALHYREVPQALDTVRQSTADRVTRLAFEFLVLTAGRSGEVRLATWDEIDRSERTWIVPAERMKARRERGNPTLP